MRLEKVKIENFRCFKNLELEFCLDRNSGKQDSKFNTTILVASNGQGKTAILEALVYLLGAFIARFPKVSVPRINDSDYRDEWRSTLIPEKFIKKPRASYMGLFGEGYFSVGNDCKACNMVKWDILKKRDNSRQTESQIPKVIGTREINEYADFFIDHYNMGKLISMPVVAYYNTERAVIRNKPERRRGFQKVFNRYDAYVGALDNGLNYKKTIEWFCFLEHKKLQEMEKVRDWDYQTLEYKTIQLAVEKMLPGFSNLHTVSNPLDLAVDIKDDCGEFKTCRIDTQLSDGYKIVLVLVLDLVARILEANSCIENITPEELLHTRGIVLIDEVDLHLHPSWQQRIIGDLQRTFPNIQFIVTTHSPQVISSVPKECVRIISNGAIVPFNTQTQGVESQMILAEIFGTSSVPENDPWVVLLNKYANLEALGQADTADARDIYVRLVEHFGSNYQPLLRIEMHRKFMAKKREQNNA